MADSVEIEFQEQNPTIVEVLVNQTVTNIDVTVEAPIAPQVIEVHVDVNSAQVALDAAVAAQNILEQMQELIGSVPTFPSLQFTKLLSVGAITVVGNTVSVASASALISGVEVVNAAGISFMVPFAFEGKIRIDLVVLNSDGDLLRIAGTETDSGNIAIPPINLVPPTAVIVTEINVTDTDLVTIIPTYLSFDEEQAIHNSANPSSSNPFATVNDTTLFKVLSQGDRPIRMSDGDGDTMLELDDRGKLVYNIYGDFLHLPAELHPDNSVLKIHNIVDSDLFLIPTDDVPYTIISGLYIDEFTGITLKKGTAVLTKVNDFEWLLTYELLDFSKEALGLENVDNTSDMAKPVSTAQAAAISSAASNARNEAIVQAQAKITFLKHCPPAKVAADVDITPLSGAKTIQGVNVGVSDIVLLMNQTDPKENGLWVIASGSGGSLPWIRLETYNTGSPISGIILKVYSGDYSGREFRSVGSVGSNINIIEVTDSKLKPSIGSDTKSTMTQKAISDELAKKVSFWSSGLNGITVANTLAISPTYSQLIPANTFISGDNVFLNFRVTSPGAKTSASSIYFYVNTEDNLSGATQLGVYTGGATNRTLQADRMLSVKGSTTKTINPTASISTDTGATSAMTSHTINWAVDQYIIFAIGHTVNDQTMFGDFYSIEKK